MGRYRVNPKLYLDRPGAGPEQARWTESALRYVPCARRPVRRTQPFREPDRGRSSSRTRRSFVFPTLRNRGFLVCIGLVLTVEIAVVTFIILVLNFA